MLWNKDDLTQYAEAKEYIDTLLIPLVPFTFDNEEEMQNKALQGELIRLFTKEIEKEFKGRIMLPPDYMYLSASINEKEINRLDEWTANMKSQPFEYIFFFTFDSQWRKYEKQLDGTVIWLPGMTSGNNDMQAVIKGQLTDIKAFIRSYWL